MEKTKKYFILMLALLGTAFSNPFLTGDTDTPSQILLKDIGILGLASHDIFSWDGKSQASQENGRLDLSTVFANDKDGHLIKGDWYHANQWQSGGNKKNSENAPVYTITSW